MTISTFVKLIWIQRDFLFDNTTNTFFGIAVVQIEGTLGYYFDNDPDSSLVYTKSGSVLSCYQVFFFKEGTYTGCG